MESKLTGVSETLLIPLWARAYETKKNDPIIVDKKAIDIMNKIDYDFSKFDKAWMSQVGVAIRARLLDDEVKKFLENNPESIVINIGCGLDTRFERVDNEKVIWYDLDLPEAIKLRKNFFESSNRYKMIDKSVFDYSWMEYIQAENKKILIVAEGVFMYFKEKEVRDLLILMHKKLLKFECLIDVITPFAVRNYKKHDSVKKTEAAFNWGIQDGKDLEKYSSHLKFKTEWNLYDFYKNRWRHLKWLSKIPFIRHNLNGRIIHFSME